MRERKRKEKTQKMQLDKVILRAIGSTLAAIGILLLVMLLSCSFFFPSTLMNVACNLGMESVAVHYAERAYKLDDGAEYMAYAFSVSVENGNYKKVEKYGKKLIDNDEFEEYCALQDEEQSEYYVGSYAQYVYGNTYAAQYRNGDKVGAIENAKAKTISFEKGNALARILIASLQAEDLETARTIYEELTLRWQTDGDNAYLAEMIALAERYIR